MYEAYDADDPERQIRLAEKALDISRDCADAYTLLSEYAPDSKRALGLCAEAVAAAERSIGPAQLASYEGDFWSIVETRPYMRARLEMAQKLWAVGRRVLSIDHLAEMLKLNPNDNQGVRYILAARLLEMGRDSELEPLLSRYDEPSTFWSFAKVLAAFRREGNVEPVRKLLRQACKRNKHVAELLLEKHPSPRASPALYSAGDESEAEIYVQDFAGGWRQTPGAITWLRQVTAESRRRKRRASRGATGPTQEVKRQLLGLPQRFGTEWQASVHRLPTWVEDARLLMRPWSVLAVDHSEHLIVGQDMIIEKPSPEQVFDQLVESMSKPLAGEAHRPSEIQVIEDALWESLRPHLEEIGVDCIFRTELDEVEYIHSQMLEMFRREQPFPGLVDTPGIEPREVAGFFAAAADYYRKAPWRRLGVETAIRVECEAFRQHRRNPWYAVVMGQSNLTLGLALYIDLETIHDMWWGDSPPQSAGQIENAISVAYNEPFEIPMTDLLACEANRWPIGGPEAYPLVLCSNPSFDYRPPEPWELHLLEGCLRAIPEFIERHDLFSNPAEETIGVSTAAGSLEMKLTWSPDFDTCDGICDDCHECDHSH